MWQKYYFSKWSCPEKLKNLKSGNPELKKKN